MRKFEYKYRIDEKHRTVVALSSFAGKVVVGVARCAPEDVFDIEFGKKLATARCALKLAEKRMKYAEECLSTAIAAVDYWTAYKARMESYDTDSVAAYQSALVELTEIEKTF